MHRRRTDRERDHVAALYRTIYAVIRRIPPGRIATYGQVAEIAGIPGGARIAAAALKVSDGQVPWQRVCGKASKTRARIAILDPVGAAMQRAMLEDEGVALDATGKIELATYGWRPYARIARTAATGSRARGARPRPRPRSGSKTRASPSRR